MTKVTPSQARLLALLLTGKVVKRIDISRMALRTNLFEGQRGVDQLVSQLRKKVVVASNKSVQIISERGDGYRMVLTLDNRGLPRVRVKARSSKPQDRYRARDDDT